MRLQQYIVNEKSKGKPITFVRFGGLSSTSQKKFYKKDTFHSPPAKKGIFAFIWPYVEDFLWVWKVKYIPNETEAEWKKRKNEYMKKNTKKFQYSGMIWTHFGDVITGGIHKGTWVKIHTNELNDILKKIKHRDTKEVMKYVGKEPIQDPYKRGLGGFMSKDHLEVFIEKVN